MKARSLFLIVWMLACCYMLQAQDIIITKDAQKIEAKILEVSNSEIKYKKQSNLEGPTFILGVEELNSIIYANGEVQVFNNTRDQEHVSDVPIQEYKQEMPQKTILTYNANSAEERILRIDDNIYDINGIRISEAEYIEFIRTRCPIAYNSHMDALKKIKLGKTFCMVSIGFSLASLVCSCIVIAGNYDFSMIPSWCCIGGAAGFLAAGIPLSVIGSRRRHSSHELYNQQCSGKLSLNLQSGKNGFGLALRF